jgi:hypothetical protein
MDHQIKDLIKEDENDEEVKHYYFKKTCNDNNYANRKYLLIYFTFIKRFFKKLHLNHLNLFGLNNINFKTKILMLKFILVSLS